MASANPYEYYRQLISTDKNAAAYRLSRMDNASAQAEANAIKGAISSFMSVIKYIDTPRASDMRGYEDMPQSQYDASRIGVVEAALRDGLGINGTIDRSDPSRREKQLIYVRQKIEEAIGECNEYLRMIGNRQSYFSSDEAGGRVDRAEAERVLGGLVGMIDSVDSKTGQSVLVTHLSDMYEGGNVAEYNRLLRYANALRGEQFSNGQIKDKPNVRKPKNPGDRVADEILKFAYMKEGSFGARGRTTLEGQSRRADEFGQNLSISANTNFRVPLSNIEEGTTFAQTGASLRDAATKAISLDYDLTALGRKMAAMVNPNSASAVNEALAGSNMRSLRQIESTLYPNDRETFSGYVDQFLATRKEAESLARLLGTVSDPDQQMEFNMYYIGADEEGSVSPKAWELGSEFDQIQREVIAWKKAKDAAASGDALLKDGLGILGENVRNIIEKGAQLSRELGNGTGGNSGNAEQPAAQERK